MKFIKRLLCSHEWEFVRNIYGDEINHVGGKRSWWRCKKCGKWQLRPHLFDEEVPKPPAPITSDGSQHSESTQYCKNCRYFDIDFIETDKDRHSWCHRYPPVYVGPSYETLSQTYDVPNNANYWDQPTVGIMNWCGEWRQRE